jgi:hypothetical protein
MNATAEGNLVPVTGGQRQPANALAVYQQVTDPMKFAMEMGKSFAAATGAPLEQGPVIALACLTMGITYLDFVEQFHLIGGKPTKKTSAMLTDFRENYGGKHRVIKSTPTECEIEFTPRGEEPQTFRWTWEQAQQSRWPWKDPSDHKKGFKDNWSTPEDQENMLFNRLVSKSLRKICPECVRFYSPEEMQDVLDVEPISVRSEPVRPTASQVLAQQANVAAVSTNGHGGDVIEGDFTAAEPATVATAEQTTTADDDTPGTITVDQREAINELIDELRMPPDKITLMLQKRRCNSIQSLSQEEAKEIIVRLGDKLRNALAASDASKN